MHSQNNEAQVVIDYFNGRIGTVLSLGENDGTTFSNSRDLIEFGWSGHLFEPVRDIFERLNSVYAYTPNVFTYNFGISDKTEWMPIYQTGDGIISTIGEGLLEKWGYNTKKIDWVSILSFADAKKYLLKDTKFEFITIDCEGFDYLILTQIDLAEIGCECICLEQGNDPENYKRMKEYCAKFGLTKELLYNFENVILAK